MRRRHASATPITALPNDVLARIFSLCTDHCAKAAILATCRNWRAAASADPAFWDLLVLNGSKLGKQLSGGLRFKLGFTSFLRRQQGVVRRLRLLTGTTAFGTYLPTVLGCFRGGALEELTLELGAIRNYEPLPTRTTQRIIKEVLALQGLRHLSVAVAHQSIFMDFSWHQLAALSSLTALESLSLAGGLEGEPPAAAFSALSRLSSLSLRQDSGALSSAAPLLAGLSGLQHVELCAFRLDVAPPQLEAQWQQLRELVLRSVAAGGEEEGEGRGGGSAWDVLSRLPQLTGLTVVAGLVAPLRAGAVQALARSRSVQCMRIGRYAEPSLPDLVLGDLPALTRLRLSVASDLEVLPPSWCEALAPSLVCLEVENCYRLRLPPQLSRLAALQRLGVNHQRLEEVPPAILPMAQLTRLAMCANTLRELSPGPYLRNLRELVLFANAFTHIPPALAAATQLQLLDLTMNWDLDLGKRRQDYETLGKLSGSLTRLLLRRWPGGSEGGWCGGRAEPKVERRLRRLLPRTEVVL